MIIGILIAFAVLTFKRLNGVILGIVVGYIIGNLIYNVLVKLINVNPQMLYWSTVLFCILAISISGGFMEEYMTCVATSLVGAYSLVRVSIMFNIF